MSARERIMRFVRENEPSYGSNCFFDPETGHGLYEDGEIEQHVSALLDAFAHELAEKIRAAEPLHFDVEGRLTDMRRAADLIDPEVSDG